MIEHQKSFLTAILGTDGANALFKSVEKSELIAQALLPRAIFSWVKGVGEFEGFIPGSDELISFTKSENGFTGKVGNHEFKDESLIHVAAVLAVTMGTEKGFNTGTKSADLEKLGKSIDLLVRSQLVQEGLEKAEKKCTVGCILKLRHKGECKLKELEKANPEPPVKNAAPVAPTAPVAAGQTPAVKPAAPAAVAKAPKMPKIKTGAAKPAGATVALTRSEMNHKCPACADSQFKDNEFVGCICFQALNKSIDMLALDELGCVIHVSEPMDVIVTLLESMGRE